MANLFPVGYEDLITEADDSLFLNHVGYKKSVDFSDGDLTRNGLNSLNTATGVLAWEHWCQNCLATERYACPVYSTDFGIEIEEAFHTNDKKKSESILTREIREALMADPYKRTKSVESITFKWSPDSVDVDVHVIGIDEATIDVNATIRRR
ncbi:MAG: DUF2634 domain-containing protein [Firmicutes bacterium]|nr:DUF2634 domain-containing protein [Bacillota bacterium]